MARIRTFLSAAVLVAACSSGNDADALISVNLQDTRLIGAYALVDYLFEYGDGARLDPSILAITGTLSISADSSYREGVRVGADSTPTVGKITRILISNDKDAGELQLTLDGSDSAAGNSDYSFRHDTLVLVTDVSKERDAAKKGFRETAYYARNPAVVPE